MMMMLMLMMLMLMMMMMMMMMMKVEKQETLKHVLIDWIEFYSVLAIFQPCNTLRLQTNDIMSKK